MPCRYPRYMQSSSRRPRVQSLDCTGKLHSLVQRRSWVGRRSTCFAPSRSDTGRWDTTHTLTRQSQQHRLPRDRPRTSRKMRPTRTRLATAHAEHSAPSPSGPEYPALQTHIVLPLFECELIPHATQEEPPVAFMKVPAGHGTQLSDPATDLDVPDPHGEHPVWLTPVYPALHKHPSTDWLPAVECELTSGHSWHAVAPEAFWKRPGSQLRQRESPLSALYDPAVQALQDWPFRPVNPALHKQSCTRVLPTLERECSKGHGVQEGLPNREVYVPASH
eukprot:3478938-Rhodomonas_salina.4